MRKLPGGGDPAPRAAGRVSDAFSSAGEHSKDTQAQPRIQAAEATRSGVPASPAVISVCDDLQFQAIAETLALAESHVRSVAEAAWRGDRLTLGTHLQQVHLSAITAIQIFKGLGQHYAADGQTRGEVAK
jgi:hypothetical protein